MKWPSCTKAGSSNRPQPKLLFTQPQHPYTAMLLEAAPAPDPHASWMEEDEDASEAGEPTPADDQGCAFAPRCRYKSDLCSQQMPALEGESHLAACHHKDELELHGV